VTAATDHMALARDERTDLADLLATLTPAQWETPTLCERWRVRDVVAHMFSYEELGPVGVAGRLLRGRLNFERVNAAGVAAHAGRSPDELLAMVRRNLRPRGLTAAFGGRVALTDGMIHHQDIRRPLGAPRDIPAERLRAVLEFARSAPPIRAKQRIQGLRLVATDVGWSTGSGPVVEGPGEPLLMAMAGRRGVVGGLTGPGQPVLAERIGG
jgi:uncharacterized protein (TIGR03083 family)